MNEDIEMTQITVKRWSPKRLTASDIVSIVQDYGSYNDSLTNEEYDDNPVEWEIAIKVKRVGGVEIWP